MTGISEITGEFDEISRRVSALAEEKNNLMAKLNESRPRVFSIAESKAGKENDSPQHNEIGVMTSTLNLPTDSLEIKAFPATDSEEIDSFHISAKAPKKTDRLLLNAASSEQNLSAVTFQEVGTIKAANTEKVNGSETIGFIDRVLKVTGATFFDEGLHPPPCSSDFLSGQRLQSALSDPTAKSKQLVHLVEEVRKEVYSGRPQGVLNDIRLLASSEMSEERASKFSLLVQAKDFEISSLMSARQKADEQATVLFAELGDTKRCLSKARRELAEAHRRLDQLSDARSRDLAALRESEAAREQQDDIFLKHEKAREESTGAIRQLQRDLELARLDCRTQADQLRQAKSVEAMLSDECKRLEGMLTATSQHSETIIKKLRAENEELFLALKSAQDDGAKLHESLQQEAEEKRMLNVDFVSEKQVLVNLVEKKQAEAEDAAKRCLALRAEIDMLTEKLSAAENIVARVRSECAAALTAEYAASSSLRMSLVHSLQEAKRAHHESLAGLHHQIEGLLSSFTIIGSSFLQRSQLMRSEISFLNEERERACRHSDEQSLLIINFQQEALTKEAHIASLQGSVGRYRKENSELHQMVEVNKLEIETSAKSKDSAASALGGLCKVIEAVGKISNGIKVEIENVERTLVVKELKISQLATTIGIKQNVAIRLQDRDERIQCAVKKTYSIIAELSSAIEFLQQCKNMVAECFFANQLYLKDAATFYNLKQEHDSLILQCTGLKEFIAREKIDYESKLACLHQGNIKLMQAFESLQAESDHSCKHYKTLLAATKKELADSENVRNDLIASFQEDRDKLLSLIQEKQIMIDKLTLSISTLKSYTTDASVKTVKNHNAKTDTGRPQAEFLSRFHEMHQAVERTEHEKKRVQQELEVERASRESLSTAEQTWLSMLKIQDAELQSANTKIIALESLLKKTELERENTCRALYLCVINEEQLSQSLIRIGQCLDGLSQTAHDSAFEPLTKPILKSTPATEHIILLSSGSKSERPFSFHIAARLQEKVLMFCSLYLSLQREMDAQFKKTEAKSNDSGFGIQKVESAVENQIVIDTQNLESCCGSKEKLPENVCFKSSQNLAALSTKLSLAKTFSQGLLQQLMLVEQDVRSIIYNSGDLWVSPLKPGNNSYPTQLNHYQRNSSDLEVKSQISFNLNSHLMNIFLFEVKELKEVCVLLYEDLSRRNHFLHSSNDSGDTMKTPNNSFSSREDFDHFQSFPCEAGNLFVSMDEKSAKRQSHRINQSMSQNRLSCSKIRSQFENSTSTAKKSEIDFTATTRHSAGLLQYVEVLKSERNFALEKIQRLTATVDRLKRDLSLLSKPSRDKHKLLQEIKELNEKQEDLQGEVQKLRIAVLERNTSLLEMQRLAEPVFPSSQERFCLRKVEFERNSLLRVLDDIKGENEALKEEMLRIRNIRREGNKAQLRCKELQEDIDELHNENKRLRKEASKSLKIASELRDLQEQNENLRNDNLRLQSYEIKDRINISKAIQNLVSELNAILDQCSIFDTVAADANDLYVKYSQLNQTWDKRHKTSQNLRTSQSLACSEQNSESKLFIDENLCFGCNRAVTNGELVPVSNLDHLDKVSMKCDYSGPGLYLITDDNVHLKLKLIALDQTNTAKLDYHQISRILQASAKEVGSQQAGSKNRFSLLSPNDQNHGLPCFEEAVSTGIIELFTYINLLEGKAAEDQERITAVQQSLVQRDAALAKKDMEMLEQCDELESMQFRIASMEQRLKRKDFETQCAIQEKENQIVEFLRAVEAKAVKKDCDLADTRARLLRAEAELSSMMDERGLMVCKARTIKFLNESSEYSEHSSSP